MITTTHKAVQAALWLAENTHLIARHEHAGDCHREIQNTADTIERLVNRPIPPRYCGNCPTVTQDKRGEDQTCAIPLYAKREAPEVCCWKCKTTYNVDDLIQHALNEVHDWLWSSQEVLEIMAQIGEPISPRTWRHWRATGAIQSRNELGAEPKYHIEEVRYLRLTQAKTRAS